MEEELEKGEVERMTELGHKMIDLFNLKAYRGKYHTAWGDKTPLGIGRTVDAIVKDY